MAPRTGKQLLEGIRSQVGRAGCSTALPRWDLTPEEIAALADAYIEDATATYDAVAAAGSTRDGEPPSWNSVCAPMCVEDIVGSIVDSTCTFPTHVSADKLIRDASNEAEQKLRAFQVETASRHDVFQALAALEAQGLERLGLGAEQKRYIERHLREGRRKGLHLDESTRARVLDLNQRMTALGIAFAKNTGEEDGRLLLSRDELAGLPGDVLEALESGEDGKLVVTLKYPHYIPLMKMCSVDATRRTAERAFNSRCLEDNTAILEDLVRLRHEKAQLLGYKTHADFVLETRMAKSPENVAGFLNELAEKLTPLQEAEMAVLLEMKRAEKEAAGQPFDETINAWDMSYYQNMVEKKHYSVDQEALKLYFPMDKVTSGLLEMYQELLGLTFAEMTAEESGPLWHEDVQMFRVTDTNSSALVGYFYLDLYPREGKYGHAACFGLQPSSLTDYDSKEPQGRVVPVAALVCNFTKPTKDSPSLLQHSEVETFFHEFGHGMHQLCSTAALAEFAGTAVERDFVEAPSQMLENWVWEPEAISRLSGHVDDGRPLPEDLMAKLIKSRTANAGIFNKRQILLATFDQCIHTRPEADTAAVLAELTQKYSLFQMTPGTNMAASFGHLAGGYDSQYYGYMYSEVFSADMFRSRFKAAGLFSREVGRDYREKVLAPGGSKDADELLRDFLGRDPAPDAFLQSKGL